MTNQVDEKTIERIRKLLALAGNNSNEAEAAAALAKAQALLEEHNLDMSVVDSSGKTKRSDAKRNGGLYSWQRKLWQSVAEMNFCYYISIKGLQKGSTYEHRIIGSHANVVATELMAQYLQETIERLAQRWAKDNAYKSVFVREAIAYREGMASRISERLQDRRDAMLAEARKAEEERKREQARTNADPGTQALTILDVVSTEADFNNDYLNNWEMGTTARKRREREAENAKWRAEYAAQQKAQVEWDAANPEAAAQRKAREKAEYDAWIKANAKHFKPSSTKVRARASTPEEKRAGLWSFGEGRAKGNEVGIDTQVDRKAAGAIR
jgi:hypothetical protein